MLVVTTILFVGTEIERSPLTPEETPLQMLMLHQTKYPFRNIIFLWGRRPLLQNITNTP